MAFFLTNGGRGGIRTHDTLSGMTVFKTVRFNRSRTLPCRNLLADYDVALRQRFYPIAIPPQPEKFVIFLEKEAPRKRIVVRY